MALDFGFLLGLTASAILALSFQRRGSRVEGGLLTLSYASYIAWSSPARREPSEDLALDDRPGSSASASGR